jgi:hypothetical protein
MPFEIKQEHRAMSKEQIKQFLLQSLEREEEMMRSYLIAAERIDDDAQLKLRLREFAEGNAKRSRQLQDELNHYS